jgi:predicted nucleic acid-binding protein
VIFVDTSFWAALMLARDANHPEARALLGSVGNEPLVTSNHVRGETWTFLRRKAGHQAAVAFLDRQMRSKQLKLVSATAQVEDRAIVWLREHDEREYSFVDATSFALMRSMKIRKALAFDGDFTAAGFDELRP